MTNIVNPGEAPKSQILREVGYFKKITKSIYKQVDSTNNKDTQPHSSPDPHTPNSK